MTSQREIRALGNGAVRATAVVALALGCAVPVAPSGGPPDREEPHLVDMRPPNNSVNFSGTTVEFVFDEYVDEGSFLQALEITPEPAYEPDLKWSGKRVRVQFRDPLEQNTTYILTIGTRLRDLHNVSLKAPIIRAFSTGSEINRARIRGRIVSPRDGLGVAGMQVFAYPDADTSTSSSLPERPLYRTETDESGNFEFGYLSRRPYFVLGVRDRNSNRRPDNLETIAVPPSVRISADTTQTGSDAIWYAAVFDTVAPELRRTDAVSSSRIELRYSEDAYFDPDQADTWMIFDSTGAPLGSATALYRVYADARLIGVITQPLARGAYLLEPGVVADSAGNIASRAPIAFRSDGRVDTASVSLSGFLPKSDEDVVTLHPDEPAGFMLTGPADSAVVVRRIAVSDTSGTPIPFSLRTSNRIDYYVVASDADDRSVFELQWNREIPGTDSVATRRYHRLMNRDFGSISGVVSGYPDTSHVVVEAARRGRGSGLASSEVDGSGRFSLSRLLPGAYRLSVFRDDNRSGSWTSGGLTPYRPAEPIFWTPDSVRVRARWETEIDTVKIRGFIPEAE